VAIEHEVIFKRFGHVIVAAHSLCDQAGVVRILDDLRQSFINRLVM
jgi:hypothetical protein